LAGQVPDTAGEGSEPVLPEESILRRISYTYMEGPRKDKISPNVFKPRLVDTDGLSFFRENFHTPKELACAPGPESRHVARVAVESINALGLSVRPDPDPPKWPGHCIVPELHAGNRDDPWAKDLRVKLAGQFSDLVGPILCADADGVGDEE